MSARVNETKQLWQNRANINRFLLSVHFSITYPHVWQLTLPHFLSGNDSGLHCSSERGTSSNFVSPSHPFWLYIQPTIGITKLVNYSTHKFALACIVLCMIQYCTFRSLFTSRHSFHNASISSCFTGSYVWNG